MSSLGPFPGASRKKPPRPPKVGPLDEPDELNKHKFRIGNDFIEYYRDPEDSAKVFIPTASLGKITLLSPESAKNLMENDDN